MKNKIWLGELIGTFILVAIGCSVNAYALINGSLSLMSISLLWGLGVFIAILVASMHSNAHLNPAVSFAYLLKKKIDGKTFLTEVLFQLIGAVFAGVCVYLIFNSRLESIEMINGWERDEPSGLNTAKVFGEFYNTELVGLKQAIVLETLGTFLLLFMIFQFEWKYSKTPKITAFFIGLVVAAIIFFVAPYTQCGINPARDFGPRLVSFLLGWKYAFSLPNMGAILVYVIGPLIGASLAVFIKVKSNS